MIETILWILSFVTLYLAVLWLNFLYINLFRSPEKITRFPSLTIAVPAYNEERGIIAALKSFLSVRYPKDKLKILVIDDGSKDNTAALVGSFIKKNPSLDVTLIRQDNRGKAGAMNTALKHCRTELFACVDADSRIERNSIRPMLKHFDEERTAAVISAIKVADPKNIFEKVQRIEYILAVLSRKLRASINTLAMTPGVLSVYKTGILRKVGGFDEGNITEDFEVAMRLRKNGYFIKIESDSYTYTKCPDSFRALWNQRIRWYRGFLLNHWKHREMFFNKKYGRFFSYFQLPLNILYIPLLLGTVAIVSYGMLTHTYEFIVRSVFLNNYLSTLLYIPSLKEFILGYNIKVMFPIMIAFVAGAYMFYIAHRQLKEKIFFPISIWAYFALLPYLSSAYWISAISNELLKTKRKW